MAEFETLLFDVGDDHVATITLDRPEVLNAFDQPMADSASGNETPWLAANG
jgi:enoyl-CoA hydratase/carnithine racemase